MISVYLFTSLVILATGAQAIVTSFTFHEGESWFHNINAEGDVVEPGSLVPGWLSHRTQCVDRKDGINSVDVKETGSLGESLYCIKGYKETDCEGEEIAFTYPWDSAQRGDGNYTFPVTVGAAGVVTIDRDNADSCPEWNFAENVV